MRPQTSGTDTAILVSINFGEPDYAESLEELRLLTETAGVRTLAIVESKRQRPNTALFAGTGKVQEIAELVAAQDAPPVVIFNHDLSPAQMRNLTAELQTRVLDRTMLILDIFAQRAQSHEGKVQVELAQLRYLSTRLVGQGSEMAQQKHAVGARGPGETRLELDRRKLERRVLLLKERLEKLRHQRTVQRRARNRQGVLSVSLVGYTNAGKSTLFNRLTKAGVYVADQLFATLDTTSRKIYAEGEGEIVVSDTVGFIRHLPHGLVAAFRGTLEETALADMLLHVVDASNPNHEDQIAEVNKVLAEIGAEHIPQVLIFNKIDVTETAPSVERDDYGRIRRVFLSARTGAGMDELRDLLLETRAARQAKELIEKQLKQARESWD